MDGTIVDNMQVHFRTWLDLFHSIGKSISEEEMHRQNKGLATEILRRVLGSQLSDEEVLDLRERKEALYRDRYRAEMRPIAGFRQFLDEARRLGVPMALATAAGYTNIEFVLDGLGIRSYFDVVVGADDVQHGKPDPEVFLTAASRLGVLPDRCLVFEDSPVGVEASYRAGMRTVVILTGEQMQGLQVLPGVVQAVKDYTALQPAKLVKLFADI